MSEREKALAYVRKNLHAWPEGINKVSVDPDGEIRFYQDASLDFFPDDRESFLEWPIGQGPIFTEDEVMVSESPEKVTESEQIEDPTLLDDWELGEAPKLTGGSSNYYKVIVEKPTTLDEPYQAECNDIIEALDMTFAEGNAFKAIWRTAAARQGNGKPGTTAKYDAEKVVFFGKRMLVKAGEEV